jgi:hypothetical protein
MTIRKHKVDTKTCDDAPKLRGLLRRRTSELNAVRDIFHAINATSDVRSILDTIVHTTAKAMRVDSASIYLLDTATQSLLLKATTGLYRNRSITLTSRWVRA